MEPTRRMHQGTSDSHLVLFDFHSGAIRTLIAILYRMFQDEINSNLVRFFRVRPFCRHTLDATQIKCTNNCVGNARPRRGANDEEGCARPHVPKREIQGKETGRRQDAWDGRLNSIAGSRQLPNENVRLQLLLSRGRGRKGGYF